MTSKKTDTLQYFRTSVSAELDSHFHFFHGWMLEEEVGNASLLILV